MNGRLLSSFGKVLEREGRRILSRPIYFVLIVVIPLLTMTIPHAIFRLGVPRKLPIAVCDLDHSQLSRHLSRLLDANSYLQVTYQVPNAESGRQLILSGRVYMLVVLPRDLERDVNLGRSPKIASFYNNQWFSVGGIVNRELGNVINHEIERLKLRFYMSGGKLPDTAAAQSNPIRVDTHMLFNPFLNYENFLAMPLVPALLQIVVTMTTIFVIGLELKRGTASEWLEAAGGNLDVALLGKLLPYSLVFVVMAATFNAWLFGLVEMPDRGHAFFLWIATVLMVLAYQAVGITFIALFGSLRLSVSLATIYCGPAFAFGGVTFPLLAVTVGGKIWSAILPLPYFLQIMVDQAIRGAPWRDSMFALGVLVGFVLLGPALAHLRLGRILVDPRYRGRT
ncbi:MAG TPA: ABC transporter permease [Desulfomonilaceae bacterium]|nr:ABC transporter permease [Desulfomonilaceae bacterium]HVN77370.1 ABC transporter permease [Terriglobia bacterium]